MKTLNNKLQRRKKQLEKDLEEVQSEIDTQTTAIINGQIPEGWTLEDLRQRLSFLEDIYENLEWLKTSIGTHLVHEEINR